jgi:hypothetical protein
MDHFAENGIEFETEDDSKIFDASFFHNEATRVIAIKIRQEDIKRADELLNQMYLNQLTSVDNNYYIYKMTDDELLEIIKKPDEWNPLDFELAKKILKEKGKEISSTELDMIRQRRIEELARPAQDSSSVIYLGWAFIVAGSIIWLFLPWITSFGFNLLGIMIGANLMQSKKKLPNSEVVFTYNNKNRKDGRTIMITGIILLSLAFIFSFIVFNSYAF